MRGITLAETLVAAALVLLLAGAALAGLNLTLFHWSSEGERVDSAAAARMAMACLTSELRGGLPDPTAGGYGSLYPPVTPTAVLKPNANQTTADELVFTEPVPGVWNPLSPGFDPDVPANYRKVRYRALGGRVLREVTTSTGQVTEALVCAGERAVLKFTWRAPDLVDVQVTCGTGTRDATLTSRVQVVGR